MATIVLVLGRAKRFNVSAIEGNTCLPTSVCVVVAKFRVRAASLNNERMPEMLEGVVDFVAVEAKPQVFSEGVSASGG